MHQTYRYKRTQLVQATLIAAVVAAIGLVFILSGHASTPTAAVETESGTIGGSAALTSDTSASGGKAIRFAAAVAPPAGQCASGGSYLWANLVSCGWPGPTNTGAVASQCPGGVLTTNTGSITRTIHVTAAGSTISCQNITGCLSIEATNVTVTNVKINCSSGKTGTDANGTSVIYVDNGASATITNTEINGLSGVHACIWHQGTSLAVSKVNCYGINDGIFSWADTSYSATTGDNFTIQDSYFHDFTNKTANGHIDGYQAEGAGNGLISHNTYLMTSDDSNSTDSAIAIWNGNKSSHDITIQNNLISGGGFAVYAEDYVPSEASPAGSYSVTNINFSSNKFSTHLFGCVGDYGIWYTRGAPSDGWKRTGNTVIETGENVDNGNPHSGGTLCS